ncbi:CHAP domain-containing protein [Jiangella gansuensis]|uniref:CHAP domain-containing protein n=1 Tax=Jiangella gansuensis TaxID=281473 RepID=UPI0004BC78DB|nr:CHAP domain-containing protein [Jiangella gansuensis]
MAQGSVVAGAVAARTPAAPTRSPGEKNTAKKVLMAIALAAALSVAGAASIAFIPVATVMAIWCEITERAPVGECNMQPGGSVCTGGATMVNVPEPWAEIFIAAGDEFQIDPAYLAAIYLTENGNQWKPLDTDWPSSTCCHGPMQFNLGAGTWDAYKYSADGGPPDYMDPWDSMYTAANLFTHADGFYGSVTADTPLGEVDRWEPGTFVYASASYNAGPWGNWDNNETLRYVENVHALVSSNFTQGGTGDYGQYATYPSPYGMGVGEGGETGEDGGWTGCGGGVGGGLDGVVQIAEQEYAKGIAEQPLGSNCGNRISDTYIANGCEQWCADFVSWVFLEAGIPFQAVPGTSQYFWRHDWQIPAVIGMEAWFRAGGRDQEFIPVTSSGPAKPPRPGDVMIYSGHVSIVVEVDEASRTLVTVGGNESDRIQRSSGTFTMGPSGPVVGYGRMNL